MSAINLNEFNTIFENECVERDLSCSVCTGVLTDPYTIKECFHTYCCTCIYELINAKLPCSLCQRKFVVEELIYDFHKYNSISRLWADCLNKQGVNFPNPYENCHAATPPWNTGQPPSNPLTRQREEASSTSSRTGGSVPVSVQASSNNREWSMFQVPRRPAGTGDWRLSHTSALPVNNRYSEPVRETRNFLEFIKQDDIELTNTTVNGDTRSRSGTITARNCNLKNVWADQRITLINSAFEEIIGGAGGVDCRRTAMDVSGVHGRTIISSGPIYLKNLRLSGEVTAGNSTLNAETCVINKVYSNDGIIFIDTSFKDIFSAKGGVFCRNSTLDTSHATGNSIDGEKDITLEKIFLSGEVRSRTKGVAAENCILSYVEGAYGEITLKNTEVSRVVKGSATFSATSSKVGKVQVPDHIQIGNSSEVRIVESKYGEIVIKDNSICSLVKSMGSIKIYGSRAGEVVSTHNSVLLSHSTATTVKCRSRLSLIESVVQNAEIEFSHEKGRETTIIISSDLRSRVNGVIKITRRPGEWSFFSPTINLIIQGTTNLTGGSFRPEGCKLKIMNNN